MVLYTLWLIDQHQATQQRGEGDGEEGDVRVRVSPQELKQEDQDRCEARRGGVTFELKKVVTAECEGKKKETHQDKLFSVYSVTRLSPSHMQPFQGLTRTVRN